MMSGQTRMPMPPVDMSAMDADKDAMRQYMRIAGDAKFTPDERARAKAKADSTFRRIRARPVIRKSHS